MALFSTFSSQIFPLWSIERLKLYISKVTIISRNEVGRHSSGIDYWIPCHMPRYISVLNDEPIVTVLGEDCILDLITFEAQIIPIVT